MINQANIGAIDSFLTRGVEHLYPSKEFLQSKLMKGEPLTIYFGIDPTGSVLHLGHAIPLMKLRELQDLGHQVILLIGDFTAMIGDPTDKSAARKQLTRKEVLANAKNYKKLASNILRFSGSNAVQLKYNSKWLDKLSFVDVVNLTSHFTVQQMAERDMFRKRLGWSRVETLELVCPDCKKIRPVSTNSGLTGTFTNVDPCDCEKLLSTNIKTTFGSSQPVYLHEFLYPVMQAYDSVVLDVDGEMGGNDQTFNMLAGRDLMKAMKGKEKFVVSMKLLTDSTGKKMGKTEGNMITLEDSADDMFGKVMSWTDGMIEPGFELLTRVPMNEVRQMEHDMKAGTNPRDYKERLACEIVTRFFDADEARLAADRFRKQFTQHETPTDVPVHHLSVEKMNVLDLLVATKLAPSKGEARRLIDGGGVKADGHVIGGYDAEIFPTAQGVLMQKGKRHFVRVLRG